jgi:hypothetical protein
MLCVRRNGYVHRAPDRDTSLRRNWYGDPDGAHGYWSGGAETGTPHLVASSLPCLISSTRAPATPQKRVRLSSRL